MAIKGRAKKKDTLYFTSCTYGVRIACELSRIVYVRRSGGYNFFNLDRATFEMDGNMGGVASLLDINGRFIQVHTPRNFSFAVREHIIGWYLLDYNTRVKYFFIKAC